MPLFFSNPNLSLGKKRKFSCVANGLPLKLAALAFASQKFQATPIVTSQFGQIWPKFSECFDFPENLHIAQLKGADFKSRGYFSKFGQKGGF